MKRFLLKVSVFLIYALLWHTVFPILLDPFNVFHTDNLRANGIWPNGHYAKMKYILSHPDRFNSFLFGSSRAGAVHTDRIKGRKCYDMNYSLGMPGQYLTNIKTFLANNVHPQTIYIALDYSSICTEEDYTHRHVINDQIRCPYDYIQSHRLHFIRMYLDPATALQSIATMINARLGRSEIINPEVFYKWGWEIPYDRPVRINWNNKNDVVPAIEPRHHEGVKYSLDIMREIAEICRSNNIELVIFTNPLHYVTYLPAIRDKSYTEFLEGLAEISDFWNFSSLNDITLSNDNYIETSHYKAKIGDLIVDVMCNGVEYPTLQAQGFGVKVTRENVKDFIKMLKAQAEKYPLL